MSPALTLDLTSLATVRGSPGRPSTDSLAARAFAVYDAMMTYWFQASSLIGRPVGVALTNFPRTDATVSAYEPSIQQFFITRERAFAWDVLGHEFFHFVADRGSPRVIDRNPQGPHSGGSAIGQSGRSRDEGMRLAWSEGLATFMSLALQRSPVDTSFGFPSDLLLVGDSRYTTTENFILDVDAETPSPSEGFASENSVLGLLWDLFDDAPDAEAPLTDLFAGVTPATLWDAITAALPCDPCDRVDRFWTAITRFFGAGSRTTIDLGQLFALNRIAPTATEPADGTGIPGATLPTFRWTANGDPSPAHRNDTFALVLSRDDFQGHRIILRVPPGATEYTPTFGEWQSVLMGGDAGAQYRWGVAAIRGDGPMIPEGWAWYSNVLSFAAPSLDVGGSSVRDRP